MLLTALLSCPAAAASERLLDLHGHPRALAEFTGNGKWVVLALWATDCLVCSGEAKHLTAFHEKHKNSDAVVLGLSLDGWVNRGEVVEFLDRHGVTYPNLITDYAGGAALYSRLVDRAWLGTPAALVYAPNGELMMQQVGAVALEVVEELMAAHTAAP